MSRRGPAGGLAILLLALAGCEESVAPPAPDETLFDFEAPFFVLPGHNLKDHAVVHDGRRFHLFSILNVLGEGDEVVERAQAFAHATSPDLRHWTVHPPVLGPGEEWRDTFIWAPFVVPVVDGYHMLFTGVNQFVAQCTGLARTADLFRWEVDPVPVHHPSPSWAEWDATTWSDGRDPMALRHDGTWMLVVAATARTPAGPRGAVAAATSADGLTWEDRGPLLVGPTAAVPESPFLVRRNGVWHLFVSWGDAEDVEHRASTELWIDWSARPATSMGRGHASEVFLHEGQWWISWFDGYPARGPTGDRTESMIRFDRLRWGTDPLAAPAVDRHPWDSRWESVSGSAFAFGPAFGENAGLRDEGQLGIQGSFFLSSRESYGGPLRRGDPGDHDATGLALGAVRSQVFRLRHPTLLLKVGGDEDVQGLWVRLRAAEDDRVLAWTTGPGDPVLQEVRWPTDAWVGQDVYFEVVDATPVGSLSVDDIRGSHQLHGPRVFHGLTTTRAGSTLGP